MNCLKCNKKLTLLNKKYIGNVDSALCNDCFSGLGFRPSDLVGGILPYCYDDIKYGKDYIQEARRLRDETHAKWLEEHPDMASVFDSLSECQNDEV